MFEALLERTALALDRHSIAYMVIGGQALLLYGEPRLTRDIDITLGVSPDALADVLAVVEEAGLAPLVDPHAFVRQNLVLPCEDTATRIRVDMIFSFSGYEREAIARARPVRIGAADVRFASPEDLLIHKIVAGRPRDLEDARSVLAKQGNLDLDYVRRWLGEFEALTGEPLTERLAGILAEGPA